MSWKLIKSIQGETDLRLILPFGLSLRVGDVIGVGRDGNFTLEGSCRSLLGLSAGKPRPAQGGVSISRGSLEDRPPARFGRWVLPQVYFPICQRRRPDSISPLACQIAGCWHSWVV